MMREFLITKFACAGCGSLLALSDKKFNHVRHAQGEPTGAAMVEQIVVIEPCERCIQPAHDAAAAIQTLLKIGGAA